MPDSVYVVLYHKPIIAEASVLFLRRSNKELWLPGGEVKPNDSSPNHAARRWVTELLLPIYDWHPGGIGTWRLSPKAGGHAVHLFEGYLSDPEWVRLRDPTSGLSQELVFLNRHQIHDCLCNHEMPWGQAKMAVYCLHELYKHGRRANGEQMREDLGELNGLTWNRPPDG